MVAEEEEKAAVSLDVGGPETQHVLARPRVGGSTGAVRALQEALPEWALVFRRPPVRVAEAAARHRVPLLLTFLPPPGPFATTKAAGETSTLSEPLLRTLESLPQVLGFLTQHPAVGGPRGREKQKTWEPRTQGPERKGEIQLPRVRLADPPEGSVASPGQYLEGLPPHILELSCRPGPVEPPSLPVQRRLPLVGRVPPVSRPKPVEQPLLGRFPPGLNLELLPPALLPRHLYPA